LASLARVSTCLKGIDHRSYRRHKMGERPANHRQIYGVLNVSRDA